MKLEGKKIRNILLEGNYITEADLREAEDLAKKGRIDVIDHLLNEGLLSNDLLGQAMSEFYKVTYADLNSNLPGRDQVSRIPEEIGRKYRAVLFSETKDNIVVATDDPANKDLLPALQSIFKSKTIKVAYSLPEDIDTILTYYRKALETRFAQIIKEESRIAPEIIDEIFADALSYHASDIHFEPGEKEVVVRFRVDGLLQEAGRIPKAHYENILNRIKVRSHLRTDEHYATQDGSMRHANESNIVDLRISIVPTLDGEKIAIRILSHYVRGFTLSDLGLSAKDQQILEAVAAKPFGMILVTGPTGSGKTTTLYALLKKVNTPQVNITTIEDPVEYKISGVNQIQVNPQTNLTFARGLRSIVRQDPDIILVGEIRDEETAEIAINAALTGHLLLSTFHANDAATGIPRLLDMAVEPFLLASTLEVVLAQRLVRQLCEKCRISETIKRSDLIKNYPMVGPYFTDDEITLYRGKGCPACNGTGFSGRIAIFEFILVTPELEDLILKRPSTKQIWELAQQQGSHSLFEDGLEKVKAGLTTIAEVLRIAEPPATKSVNNNYGGGNKEKNGKTNVRR
ncbi:MAG: ATPase, T2SS/T4P/T4SS family [Patescibacteria group bacterium]